MTHRTFYVFEKQAVQVVCALICSQVGVDLLIDLLCALILLTFEISYLHLPQLTVGAVTLTQPVHRQTETPG